MELPQNKSNLAESAFNRLLNHSMLNCSNNHRENPQVSETFTLLLQLVHACMCLEGEEIN